jgi:hypothetical protein
MAVIGNKNKKLLGAELIFGYDSEAWALHKK